MDRAGGDGRTSRLITKGLAERAETVGQKPALAAGSVEVATGANGVIEGKRVKALRRSLHRRFRDGGANPCPAQEAQYRALESVSGGVGGARRNAAGDGVGSAPDFEIVKSALDVIGKGVFMARSRAPAP